MIQPNEIRLGNWVLDDEGSCSKIIGFKPYDHSVRCNEDEGCYILFDRLHKGEWTKGWVTENANLQPIPLTEEILLKCGFNPNGEPNKYLSPHENAYCDKNFESLVYDTNTQEFIIDASEYNAAQIGCKFLHQLQNLFFALTGQELEYRLGK